MLLLLFGGVVADVCIVVVVCRVGVGVISGVVVDVGAVGVVDGVGDVGVGVVVVVVVCVVVGVGDAAVGGVVVFVDVIDGCVVNGVCVVFCLCWCYCWCCCCNL